MTAATPLEQQVRSILSSNREDSYATQRKRGYALADAARTLHEKFGLQKWANLGQKHVMAVVDQWKMDDRGRRGIEEKLSHLRWLVRKIGKANLVPRTNAELGVAPGPRHTRAGKTIPDEKFAAIVAAVSDERVRMALLLGRYLGLRFREAMLFRPGRDFDGQRVWVKRGTKGGRPRYLFVHSDRQREVLAKAVALTGGGDASLVPREVPTFEKWRQHCYRVLRAAGVGRGRDALFHDARRTYAVERLYGLGLRGMNPHRAAQLVARELGHGRTEILAWYVADFNGTAAA